MNDLVFGLDTFGDVPEDDSGALLSYAAAIRQVVEEAVLADQLGFDGSKLALTASLISPLERSMV